MDLDKELREFQVVVYGNLEKYSETISKGRCRIFYKYMNRNGTYITDEFAEQLIKTIPYAPVKGIYDEFNEDFTDHGTERTQGRIYGVVAAEPNFAWEKHLDDDGVEREYACVDVLLYTALYKEASEIIGKAQSMEIYEKSIEGEWMTIEGRKAFVFTKGCFLGLQALGDDVEPCFEGSAFFSLYKSLKELVDELGTYERNLNNPESNEGGQTMFDIYKLSDNAKYAMIFDMLNPNYNEEGDWEVNSMIVDIYDDYALTYSCKQKHYERVYYSKNDTTDEVALGETKVCYIVDVTEDEKTALATIQALNGGTYEKIDENFGLNSEHEEKVSEFEQKIEEANAAYATLETEKNEISDKFTEAEETINGLNTQLEELNAYKLQVETNEKEAVLAKYSAKLSEEKINEYREAMANYTVTDLDKELAFELVNSDPTVFSIQKNAEEDIIPKNDTHTKSALELVLDKYEK